MTRFQRLTLATAGASILLFAIGGLVRGSGSGLGCSTVPLCTPGHLFPSGTPHSLIEFSHRAMATFVLVLTAICSITAWRNYRAIGTLFWPGAFSFPLALVQAVLGAIVVKTDLNAQTAVTAHFITGMVLVADVVYLAANSFCVVKLPEKGPGVRGSDPSFARLTLVSMILTGTLLVVGTWVRARSAGLVFTDWPLMNGKLVPALGGAATAMFAHRVLAALAFLVVLWVAIRAGTMTSRSKDLVVLSVLGLVLFLAQIVVGAAQVWSGLKPWAVVVHVALSVLIWATAVALATVSRRFAARVEGTDATPQVAGPDDEPSPLAPSLRGTLSAYISLTKPRIIVLLLITTVPAMILAQHGMPPVRLILATLVGGTVAAGSANSINMYLDRDIDEVMRRTRRRPLPAGVITPEHALAFGFTLGATSFFFLSIVVNVVAASLALSAIAFYVFIYTMWLKRSTTQNIVIGGAAGAVPALVGWAAVTDGLAAPALILFAIVFVWTPPHFWALATRFSSDYAAAGVPMLPVVKGEDETRRQIFLYSLVLFGVTLLLVPVAHMGAIYTSAAVVLGGVFVYRALILWRRSDPDRSWSLFKYSIWYLGALFGAVALDALVPLGR
jgi:protoheme IX farnesyltransferase